MLKCVLLIGWVGFATSLNSSPRKKDPDLTTCTTRDNEEGICVNFYQCNENDTLIDDGAGILDARSGNSCPSIIDICCKMSDTRETDDPITPKPVKREGCGWRNPNGVDPLMNVDRIGNTSRFGEFPWMVAIFSVQPLEQTTRTFNLYIGGGSLIHPSIVLTIAHIIKPALNYRARAGEWDMQTQREIYPYQDRHVAEVVLHEKFNTRNLHYDIALLFLASEMNLAPNVGVVCLPMTEANGGCLASGWGKDQFNKNVRNQVILKKVELTVVDHDTCQAQLQKTRLSRFFKLSEMFMCAGGDNRDTCTGDGGSPLACPLPNQENRYTVNGLVSWGIGCGRTGTPGVYINVATFRSWIDDNVAKRGFDTKVYSY